MLVALPGVGERLRHLRNQSGRIRYDEYRVGGLPVGSGTTQSVNRHMVGMRVQQAGMRWSGSGVRGVLLRGGRWDCWWRSRQLPVPLISRRAA